MKNWIVITMMLTAMPVLAAVGGGDITLKNKGGNVTFSHDTHVEGMALACTDCHDKLYLSKGQHKAVTMKQMQKGISCGACHRAVTACNDCPKSAMIPYLRQRFEMLIKAGLFEGGCNIVTAETLHDISYRDESGNRRSFFKSFRNSLFQSTAVILSVNNELVERQSEYAEKRLLSRRELLNRTRNKLSQELCVRIRKNFDSCVSFDETCTKCQGCVSVCPTGSLQTEQVDALPIFDQSLCTGCGLCSEFCLDSAVRISRGC